jgi:hypothetical protein
VALHGKDNFMDSGCGTAGCHAERPPQPRGANVGLKPMLRQKLHKTLKARPLRREAPSRLQAVVRQALHV